MKNYYEILEVNEKASKEMINKAFKFLAKKYHPDTQKDEVSKEIAEAKFKEINEAYEILSNDNNRKEYDEELANEKNKLIQDMNSENEHLKNLVSRLQNELNIVKNNNTTNGPMSYQESTRIQYTNNGYNQQRNSRKNYYKRYFLNKLKNLMAFIITIFILIFLGIIIWKIPITNKFLVSLYENNDIIKGIVDFIMKLKQS